MVRMTEKDRYLSEIGDEQLACRAGRHDWPKLRPGQPLPPGIRATRQADGCYQVTETCGSCDKQRTWTTLRGGTYDLGMVYRYVDPKDWKRVPVDVGLTKRDCIAENIRRCAEMLFKEAR